MLDFNTEPYNDDYNEDNKFYRILFRPSFAVQARELTQLQTILQTQISRHGGAIYKQGAMVVPGQVSIDTNANYVKLTSIYGTRTTESFIQDTVGKFISGHDSKVKAQIIKVVSATSTDPTTIYVRYLSSDSATGVQKVFADSEVIDFDDGTPSIQAYASSATGTGSLATVQRGVYYVNGFFVLCADSHTGKEQTIVLDKYSNTPSYRVGLNIVESEITPEADQTLLDNAQTSYNYAAPGAHRYHIDLTLTKLPFDSVDDADFIELLKVNSGSIVRIVNTTEYSELEKTLARRTYDEAGNYTVRPFNVDVREARNNNRGAWTQSTAYLLGDVVISNKNTYTARSFSGVSTISGTSQTTAPTHTSGFAWDGASNSGAYWEYTPTPLYNRGVSLTGSDNQLALAFDPGKAYVEGYEIEKVSTEYLYIDKCRDSSHQVQVTGAFLPAVVGNYVYVNSINNVPEIGTFPTISLLQNFTTTGLTTAIPGAPGSAVQPGTITTTTSSTTVTGTSTKFTTMHVAGDIIRKADGTVIGTVASIASDTSLTLSANAASANSGISYISSRVIGTARARLFEYDNGSQTTTAAVYKLGLFDIKMTSGYDFKRNVKSFFWDNAGGGASYDFTADIVPVTTRLVGAATASSSTTITGVGTSFLTDLNIGDYILLGGTGGTVRRVVAVGAQNSITVDIATTVTGATIDRITTQIYEPENESLIYRLPYYGIKSLTSSDGTTNRTTYQVMQKFSGSPTVSGSNTALTATTTSGTFLPYSPNAYTIVDNTTGLVVVPIGSNISGGSAIFTLSGTSYATPTAHSFTVIATLIKNQNSGVTQKTKTLITAASGSDYAPVYFGTVGATTADKQAAAQNPILSLGKADGYRVTSVLMDAGSFASPTGNYTIDISDRYNFNDGQTSTYYGICRLELKPSYSVPTGPVKVTFEYFKHNSGDYFSVGSYTNIEYKKIPFYNGIPLRDCIDFRPRISDDGVTFDGTNGSVSAMPKRGQEIQADYSYYLPRTDKIAIDKSGKFFQIAGIPSLSPGEPSDPTQGMVLYTLNLEPYTFTTTSGSVVVTKTENKRYTMRDIGKLESRINNLEYYTSLSLLEQNTESMTITDPATGLNRFKNGFVVDNFSGHNVGDVSSTDYFCSIDMNQNHLRPFYSMKNVNLIEKYSDDVNRAAAQYKLSGDLITLPILSNNALITQPYASRLENINPFSIFTFLGQVNLNPPNDIWFETDRRPDIIQNQEGDFNTIATLAEKAGVLGTVWGAWQTQWTGEPVVTQNTYVGDQRGLGVVGWRDGLAANTPADQLNQMFGDVQGQGWAHRVVTTETVATQVGLSRPGINTQVVAKIDTQLVGDRILSTATIPYIRSRNILVQSTGLKPNTRFYPFFDGVDVSSYCTPATKISYTPSTSNGVANKFDPSVNVGGNTTESARLINGDAQMCLSSGEVITGYNSSATAVVVGTENVLDSNGNVTTYNLYVVNIKGTFTQGETITASVTKVNGVAITGTGISVGTIKTIGSSLITDANGKVQFLFNIPNSDSLRFRTGQRQLILSDSATNDATYTSKGSAQYNAQGVLETKQATYTSTRNGVLVSNQVDPQYKVVSQSTTRTVSDTGWYDPLAQTFMINSKGGAFLTSVDLFFATKDRSVPVHIEIREVVNGSPGKTILPFSQVALNPEQVNISSNTVQLDDGTYAAAYDVATNFKFTSPVYVNDATEYALVVASDSNGYKAWISNMGDDVPVITGVTGAARTISEQPYAGVLFKSQNGSTWTANQDQDLKFTIYQAQFDITAQGTVQFTNDILSKVTLEKDPFETNTGSRLVKVFQRNHGLAQNSYVTLSNTDSTKIYGVAPTSGTISSATPASTASTALVGTGTVWTTDIGSGTNGQGAAIYTNESIPRLIGTVASVTDDTHLVLAANALINYSGGFTIAASINGIPPNEIYKQSTVTAVVDTDSYIIGSVGSGTTAKKFGYAGGTTVQATRNIQYNAAQPQAQVQTFADTTSVFSMKTTSGKSVNGSEPPYSLDSLFTGVVENDTNFWSTPRVVASAENEGLMNGNKSVTLQCKMTTSNANVSPVLDTKRMGLIAISNTVNSPSESVINVSGLDDVVLSASNTGIAITTTGLSTAVSATKALFQTLQVGKYLTIAGSSTSGNNQTALITAVATDGSTVTLKSSTLAAVSAGDSLTITVRNTFIDEISPNGSSTQSKYVTKKISLSSPATTLKIRVSVNSPTASNMAVYYKTSPVGSKNAYSTINYTLVSPDALFPKVQYGDNTFKDVDYTITGLTPYDAFTVKLVFTSTNSSEVTRAKDLRIIACT